MIKNFVNKCKEFVFPKECSICHKKTHSKYQLCDECYKKLKAKKQIQKNGNYYSLYTYNHEVKRVIADFKLNYKKNLALEISHIIDKDLKRIISLHDINVVIPVPISKKRFLERGFNQVEEVLKESNIPYSKIERTKNTEHMYMLTDYETRQRNIHNAFKIKDLDLNNKNILLVDDLVTTGATIREIVKAIKKNFTPNSIFVFSIATSKNFKKF